MATKWGRGKPVKVAPKEAATYTVRGLRCDNCGWRQYRDRALLRIPAGQTVRQTLCPVCGCKSISRGI